MINKFENEISAINDEYKYIGTGNPNADILIIGKEAAIATGTSADQYKREVIDNFIAWKDMKDYDQTAIKHKDWANNYTPLYPYKGQMLKINNGTNYGTSRTWYNYQKLCNLIYNQNGNQNIDFHERVFITEVNSTPSAKTRDARQNSLPFRKRHFLTSEFISSFPIVLVCGVGYFKISSEVNEIEEIFGVKFIEKKIAT